MRHATCTNESGHEWVTAHEQIVAHIPMSHSRGTHTNESRCGTHTNESQWVTNKTWHTYE